MGWAVNKKKNKNLSLIYFWLQLISASGRVDLFRCQCEWQYFLPRCNHVEIFKVHRLCMTVKTCGMNGISRTFIMGNYNCFLFFFNLCYFSSPNQTSTYFRKVC